MIVVSDASPLISLSAVGQLDLLRELFRQVLVPAAVHREMTRGSRDLPGAAALRAAVWIVPRQVENRPLVQHLRLELDEGEAEAIALAIEEAADLLLVDERRGRAVATRYGLEIIGVLGVLVEAKRAGVLARIRPVMDRLIHEAGFRISRALYEQVLATVGE